MQLPLYEIIIHIDADEDNIQLGAIHLWRPHGGGGGQAQVDACGRGEGV